MPEYVTITGLTAASALAGANLSEWVQSGVSVKATGIQVRDYIAGDASAQTVIAASSPLTTAFQALAAGTANTVQITGEYQFTEDNELDYSASFTNGMSAATVTFTELPADTVAIWVYVELGDSSVVVSMRWKRSSGGTQQFKVYGQWADQGNNFLQGMYWLPTENNTIYPDDVTADALSTFIIYGYKTGA